MKNETLLHAMGQVKEEFIEEAAPMEEVSDGTTEIVIPEEENMEMDVLFAEMLKT